MKSFFLKDIVPFPLIKVYKHFRRINEIYRYKGDNVMCPICESKFKSFAPYRPSNRKNARCVNCGSLERHRLQFLYLKHKTNLFDQKVNLKLLHFAPEKVLYNKLIRNKSLAYIRCDISPNSYDFNGIKEIQKVDITNIPFSDNTFDVILCNHVLEHIENDVKAMKELYRILDIGGWGIFQVPIRMRNEKTFEDFSIIDPKERKKAFGQHDHVRVYGRDYKQRLESAGFTVVLDAYILSFSEEDCNKFGLNPREIIFLCKKD